MKSAAEPNTKIGRAKKPTSAMPPPLPKPKPPASPDPNRTKAAGIHGSIPYQASQRQHRPQRPGPTSRFVGNLNS